MATAEEKQAYADEVKAAQEEAEAAVYEPSNPDIFQSEWDEMLVRQGQDDARWLFTVTEEHGGPNIVADPEPPPEEETGSGETPETLPGNGEESGSTRKSSSKKS